MASLRGGLDVQSNVPLVVLGGTFDPVHRTHVALACAARDALGAEVRLIPNADPPHRARPSADASHRLAMLQIAIANHPGLRVDDRELRRPGSSFMVDTLQSLRDESGADRSISLLVGSDAFAGIARWHAWACLPDLANLLIAWRAGDDQPTASSDNTTDDTSPGTLWQVLQDVHWTARWRALAALKTSPHGLIARLPMRVSADSATALRRELRQDEPSSDAMIPGVSAYIAQHRLYR